MAWVMTGRMVALEAPETHLVQAVEAARPVRMALEVLGLEAAAPQEVAEMPGSVAREVLVLPAMVETGRNGPLRLVAHMALAAVARAMAMAVTMGPAAVALAIIRPDRDQVACSSYPAQSLNQPFYAGEHSRGRPA